MGLTLTEEQHALAELVDSLAGGLCGTGRLRQRMADADAFDPADWKTLAASGVAGILLDEEAGGGGGGPTEAVVVAEHLGRALSPFPFLSSAVWGATLLSDADLATRQALAAGDLLAAVVELPDAAEGPLTGRAPYVLGAGQADQLVVVAGTGAGTRIALLDRAATGVTVTPLKTIDTSQRLAEVALHDAAVTTIADGAEAAVLARRAGLLARVVLAAEQVGVAQAALDMAVAYAKIREQFGRPIGSFQAIKHKCADVLTAIEAARSLVLMAADALAAAAPSEQAGCEPVGSEQVSEAAVLVSAASVHASEAAVLATEESIQVHGGIGFTWEHDAHLYLRRARQTHPLLGTPDAHLDLVAAEVGLR